MIASGTLAKFDSYADGVAGGGIVAGELVKGSVARYFRDIQRAETDEFPYYFNRTAAGAVCDYFETFLKHSIGDFVGTPFILEPWQCFGLGNIFGWKHKETQARRFRKVFWSLGRKNGKSTLAAGVALFCASMDVNPNTGKPESVAEIVLSATKTDQTKVIYDEICRMRQQSDLIRENSRSINKQIAFNHNGGRIRTVNSDKAYDGLNPHLVIMDELHAWKEQHRDFYNTMLTGFGSRFQPLLFIVTTAGDDHSWIWLNEHKHSASVAKGDYEDEQLFPFVFEMDESDELLDKKAWPKANPNIGVSIQPGYLEQLAGKAKRSKVDANVFKRYHANMVVSATETIFDIEQWDAAAGELSDWSEADAIGGGVDLGGREDLSAWALVARYPTNQVDEENNPIWRYEVRTQSYIAEDTTRDLRQQPFAQWCYEGLLKVCKYPTNELRDDLLERCKEWYVTDIAHDPWGAAPFAETLEEQGAVIAAMPQTCAMFNEPIADLMQALRDGRLTHDGDPLLRWCVGNATAIQDRQQRWMFSKRDSTDKIDPVVAMAMAYRRAMVAPQRAHGPLFLT